MRQLNNQEIQETELQIMLFFRDYCEEHDLRYYLVGGTLLGAIRHKGFIPWDDDADVCMPRSDYEKLLQLLSSDDTGRYIIKSLKNGFMRPFARVFDTKTRIEFQYVDENLGGSSLWLDVLPVDGLPEDVQEIKKIYARRDRLHWYLRLLSEKPWVGLTPVHGILRTLIINPILSVVGEKRFVQKIDDLASKHPYGSTDYVGVVTMGRYGVGEKMRLDEFEKPVEVVFCGHSFKTFSCWDSYLTGVYGDYMTPTPEADREEHFHKAWLVD